MRIPESLFVGLPAAAGAAVPTPHVEVGADFADLPTPDAIRGALDGRTVTLIAWHVITHRRADSRYKKMRTPPPEHAAVGHFERSRWTDEAWERTDVLARQIEAQAVVLQTPASFKPTHENATRLENFVAHAMRPDLVIAWEWTQGAWPEDRALDLCDRIGVVPVVDPLESPVPDGEYLYLRVRGKKRGALNDDDLKHIALAVRDRIGWVIFSNRAGAQDASRLLEMI